jgi:hypothetical protein
LWDLARNVGSVAAVGLCLLLGVYAYPGSPLRRLIERWIDRRVDLRFDRELEQFRHKLALDADAIRAEHQRLLHNAELVTERKHEVFRELFRLSHIAHGAVAHLFGVRREPSFTELTRDDVRRVMSGHALQEGVMEPILTEWDINRQKAIVELRRVRRLVEIHDAESALHNAWNYFLTNSLYLPDNIANRVSEVFTPLREIVAIAREPDGVPGMDTLGLRQAATEQLEQLRLLLRAELRV